METQSKMTYGADIVFCIDASTGMEPLIRRCPELIPEFCRSLSAQMAGTGRPLSSLRARIIAYRDYLSDGEKAMQVTPFFDLPQETEHLRAAMNTLKADGGDRPSNGLEALAYAIRSDWNRETVRFRHIIVVLSDAPTHPLGFGKASPFYPKGMAEDFEELSAWWGDSRTPGHMDAHAKRLVLFTPYNSGWKNISHNWDKVMHLSGNCCSELEYFHYFNLFFKD